MFGADHVAFDEVAIERVGSRSCLALSSGSSRLSAAALSKVDPNEDAVLVVEDDARVRRLTLRRLRRLGYEPIEANDARAALAAFRAEPHVDLVLTDMVMPGERSGLELARSLRREVPTLPVLIVSGHSGEPLALDALRAEGIVWLRKPHDIDALGDAIEAAERALTAPDAGR